MSFLWYWYYQNGLIPAASTEYWYQQRIKCCCVLLSYLCIIEFKHNNKLWWHTRTHSNCDEMFDVYNETCLKNRSITCTLETRQTNMILCTIKRNVLWQHSVWQSTTTTATNGFIKHNQSRSTWIWETAHVERHSTEACSPALCNATQHNNTTHCILFQFV